MIELGRNINIYMILFIILIPIYSVAGESEWIWYNGHDLRFEYPSNWGLIDTSTGVVLGINDSFALSITMHKEGCYPLSQHPQLMDLMLKLWNKQMDGTPDGGPITQYVETNTGPYSTGIELYKNPDQSLICELHGYTAKNVTVTFALANWNKGDQKNILDLARIMKSLNVTLSGNHTSFI